MSQLPSDISTASPLFKSSKVKGLLKSSKNWRLFLLALILALAALLRFYNQNWDESKLLHPDERYVTVVTTQLKVPRSFAEFLNPGTSPINPYNTDWGRTYVYGTLPLFIVRNAAEWLDTGCAPAHAIFPRLIGQIIAGPKSLECGPNGFSLGYTVLVGRFWSALADVFSVLLIYLVGSILFGKRTGLLASFLGACTVFLIQIAHFYTVDSSTNFFTLLALYFCVRIAVRSNGLQAKQTAVISSQPPTENPEAQNQSNVNPFPISISFKRNFFHDWKEKVTGAWWFFPVLAGVCCGLALANKPSSFLLIAVVVLSIFVALLRDRQPGLPPVIRAFGALVIAGALAFGAFRIAQPYAFTGSSESEYARTRQDCTKIDSKADVFMKLCNATVNLPSPLRDVFTISSRWIKPLSELQGVVDGDQDMPYSQQWANRTGYLFPLTNLLFWGEGLPLGITSVLGLLYMIWQLLKGRRYWAYLIPIVWVLSNFLYYSNILGKTMRYLLPIYPILCICAAVILVAGWRNLRVVLPSRQLRMGSSSVNLRSINLNIGLVLIALVIGGNFLWALAYFNIYTNPITRLEASRWFMQNAPSAISVIWQSDKNQPVESQLFIKEINLNAGNSVSYEFRLSPADIAGENAPENSTPQTAGPLEFRINHTQGTGQVTASLQEGNKLLTSSTSNIQGDTMLLKMGDIQLTANKAYQLVLRADTPNTSLKARTSILSSEHWDDAVPMSIPGKDPNWIFNWLKSSSDGQIQNYGTDTDQKVQAQLNWLDETDYLTLSSNRLYASIPRLPWRYPATTEYYRALFNGDLGFELVADFHSFPTLGLFTFNDQEMPQPLLRGANVAGNQKMGVVVPYPFAEEAFSVYDHPRVLIFRKTSAYSRQLVEKVLGKYDLTHLVVQTPAKASVSPHGLVFDQTTQQQQNAGGTWTDIFPPASPLNHSEFLAWLAWLILIEALGLATYPLIAHVTRKNRLSALADSGFSASKILGLLIVAVTIWWLASAKLVAFERGPIWAIIIGLVIVGCAIAWKDRRLLIANIRERMPIIAASEIVFLTAFIAWTLVRVSNPDLWHPIMGGEKPMDFAYLNGVLRSTYFPAIDPWFANGYINYYYFGFVLVATPVKALGIEPAVAYNLIIPLLFALTAIGAFSVATTFLLAWRNRQIINPTNASFTLISYRSIIIGGALATIFAVLMGNLDQINTLLPALQRLGGLEKGTEGVSATIQGIGKWLGGAELPVRPEWFYWNATRLTTAVPIAEFPQFTFLYADLHAHMMAMPLALLSILFALAIASGALNTALIFLSALTVSMLWPTNSWDYPVHLVLAFGAIVLGLWESGKRGTGFARFVILAIPLYFLVTRILIIPYTENFGAAYNNIDPWTADRTPVWTYLTIHLTFILPIATHLFLETHQSLIQTIGTPAFKPVRNIVFSALLASLIVGLILFIKGVPVGIIAAPLIFLSFVAAFLPNQTGQKRIYWFLISGAFTITLFVELFTLRGDIGRMNTFFKFYIQVWIILACAAAAAFVLVVQRLRSSRKQFKSLLLENKGDFVLSRQIRITQAVLTLFCLTMCSLIFLGMLYPAFAIPAKINDRYITTTPKGLNGELYMIQATRMEGADEKLLKTIKLNDDLEVIKWFRENVKGTPNIFEGTTGGFQYRWGNRVSIYTGLPAVLGWEWHQRQQRAALSDSVVFDRNKDISEFYSTANVARALTLLRRYQTKYIVVGQMEQAYYPAIGFSKFEIMAQQGYLRRAFANAGNVIYEVLPSAF